MLDQLAKDLWVIMNTGPEVNQVRWYHLFWLLIPIFGFVVFFSIGHEEKWAKREAAIEERRRKLDRASETSAGYP